MYLYDVIVFSKSIEEHIEHSDMVLKALNEVVISINIEKRELFTRNLRI